MKPKLTTLGNGLRIVSEKVADMPSVTLGVWVAAGSRVESEKESGIAHLLEHMAFKGTKIRNARDIAEAVENVGGDINAATSHEQTVYYVRVLAEDLMLAGDILGDILNHSVFPPEELEREKAVIVQEIAATQDAPEEMIFELLQEACFPDQPLGRAIAGTAETVQNTTRDDIVNFVARNYTAPQCVVAAAGAVDHDMLLACVTKNFSVLQNRPSFEPPRAVFGGTCKLTVRSTQQVQIAFGFSGTPYKDEKIYAAHVFAGLLGGGMASRLFQEAREVRGLCYNISAFMWPFDDTGIFAMHAATGPQLVSELVPVMMDVLRNAAKDASAVEVARAKAQFKAGLLMAFENTPARADHLARSLLTHGRVLPLQEIVEKIEAVTVDDVHAYAASMLAQENDAFAAIGPEQALPKFEQLKAWGLHLQN